MGAMPAPMNCALRLLAEVRMPIDRGQVSAHNRNRRNSMGLQTTMSRQTNISKAPAVITIGMIHGRTRYNVIPDSVQMDGTIRAFDQLQRWLQT
jgi:acetylornithine deacetylase/succinyl-diaminopimelate desuccinylase-like protein